LIAPRSPARAKPFEIERWKKVDLRVVVIGPGAIGGLVGALLHRAQFDVLLVGRGEHAATIAREGLTIERSDGKFVVAVPIVTQLEAVEFTDADVVILAMKGQDTMASITHLAAIAPPSLPIVCAQNGVENERVALRYFEHVYGAAVVCAAERVHPGRIRAYSSPQVGNIDVGCYPLGVDDVCNAVSDALRRAGFRSTADPAVMRWKYAKLLKNLGNALEAACGTSARTGELARLVREEGLACYHAAGIDYCRDDEWEARIGDHVTARAIGGEGRPGGSTWQSLKVASGSVETDFLNGEIARLGRAHSVPTPVNAGLQRVLRRMARDGMDAGSFTEEQLSAMLLSGVR
jgi:2-dehydropantoate 2-reductase